MKKQKKIKNPIDVIVSSANTLISNFVKKQHDKGDIYIKLKQPGVTMDKFTSEEAKKSVKYGERYAKRYLSKIKDLLKEKGILQ